MKGELKMSRTTLALAVLVPAAAAMAGEELPSVAGFTVEEFATLELPHDLTFAPDGTMFVGWAGPGLETRQIYRVETNGTVSDYGNTPIPDPDTVLYDATGVISGVPGSVLVGGIVTGGMPDEAQIWAIRPDETVVTLWGPTTDFRNPIDMTFDSTGRYILADDFNESEDSIAGKVMVSEAGEFPSTIVSSSARLGLLAIDQDDNIYVGGSDGLVRKLNPDGTPHPDGPAAEDVGAFPPVAYGPGGLWGQQLYVLNRETGMLYRDNGASLETIGSGFSGASYMDFGPDGALYVSLTSQNRIVRIEPEPVGDCPDITGDGMVNTEDLLELLGFWGLDGPGADIAEPTDIVDTADLLELLGFWGACP